MMDGLGTKLAIENKIWRAFRAPQFDIIQY